MRSEEESMATNPDKGELTLTPSPNKRLKTLTLDQSPVSSSKGKEKIVEITDVIGENDHEALVSDSKTCGICLCEEGNAVRGWIDSCDHYFCFVCIMEWSKVESRCPMCKRRFSNIRRPPKAGVLLRERIVNVPIRDQIYHPLGNATTGPFDPYAQVECSECHGIEDESFLLLCDLCDSAAHTYCVGLGVTVPEGDWFCHDCSVSRAEHTNGEIDADYGHHHSVRNHKVPVAEADVSIFDIVQESNIREIDRFPSGTSSHPNQLSSSISPDRDNRATDRLTNSDARTLHRCRNVQNHIRVLRENWNALRRGSLGFSSNSLNPGRKNDTKNNRQEVLPDRSNQTPLTFSTRCQQVTTKNSNSTDALNKRESSDIDRAWKMLDIVKSVQQACASTSVENQVSKRPFGKGNSPKEATSKGSSFIVSKGKPCVDKGLRSVISEKNYRCQSLQIAHGKQNSHKAEKQKPSRNMVKETFKFSNSSPTTCPAVYRELPSSRKAGASVHLDVCHENGDQKAKKLLHGYSSDSNNGLDGTACLNSSGGSSTRACDLSNAKTKHSASSYFGVKSNEGSGSMNSTESMSSEIGNAKSEIQSLVKLNLKLLSRDKHLGSSAFKEIARLSTHTILAACGLEHSKSSARSFPTSVCSHTETMKQLHMSNLMPSSCRECFFVFVKDVVNSIMSEKIANTKSS